MYNPTALSDVKSITSGGWYLSNSSTVDRPYDGYSFIYASKLQGQNIITLKAIGNDGQNSFSGVLRDNTVTWLREDNFGCSTPSALASLLGGIIGRYGDDIDNANVTGIYQTAYNGNYGVTIHIETHGWYDALQISIPFEGISTKYRVRHSTEWNAWHE